MNAGPVLIIKSKSGQSTASGQSRSPLARSAKEQGDFCTRPVGDGLQSHRPTSGRNVVPHAEKLKRLREIWESRPAKEKTKGKEAPKIVKISKNDLKEWVKEFTDYELIEGQQALTPTTDGGRSRYSSPTLEKIQKIISGGGSFDPPQPILQRKGENTKQALDRYLAEIPHPLVRHRLQLFGRFSTRCWTNTALPTSSLWKPHEVWP